MARRLLDVTLAGAAAVALSPVALIAAVGIWCASGPPVIHRARRAGLDGRPFTMFKFRTMHLSDAPGASRITAAADPRVFRWGALLRRTKLDELPQLLNVLRGDMAIIGPRPEDPAIVAECYSARDRETLRVRPGLASPGSIFNYTHAERWLDAGDAEACYRTQVLPVKLALDRVYVRHASIAYDARIAVRTVAVIAARLIGVRRFADPPEMRRIDF
jgi:lipopolysaccharide/colanic/teichoic acid biosynthesis glycosyltransferase